MGLQIPCGFCAQIQAEEIIREIQKKSWRHISRFMQTKKYSVSYTIGFLKGKSALRIHRWVLDSKKTTGLNFWARGYCVSTVGLDEAVIRQYIRNQENNEQELELDLK